MLFVTDLLMLTNCHWLIARLVYIQVNRAADIHSDNVSCLTAGNCPAYKSPFLSGTTGSGLLCGFWAAKDTVYDRNHCKSIKCRKNGQEYTLVTKLGFYFLPPVYSSTPVDQTYNMTDQSPDASNVAQYYSNQVAGGQTSTTTNKKGFIFTSLCPTGGSNVGSQSQAIQTGRIYTD